MTQFVPLPQPTPRKSTWHITAWVFLVVVLIVVLASGGIMLGLDWGTRYSLGTPRDLIVSPYKATLVQYSPNSVQSCYFPALPYAYPTSILCEIPEHDAAYCPENYACFATGSTIGCLSETVLCEWGINECIQAIKELPYLTDYLDQTQPYAKVFSIESSPSALRVDVVATGVLFAVITLCAYVKWNRNASLSDAQKRGVYMIALAGMMLIVFVYFMGGLLFFATSAAPFFSTSPGYGACYDSELNKSINTAQWLARIYFEMDVIFGWASLALFIFYLSMGVYCCWMQIRGKKNNLTPDCELSEQTPSP